MKTVVGYLLRLLGIFFSFSVLGNIINIFQEATPENTTSKLETFGAIVVAFVLAILCFKYGNKKLDEVKAEKKHTATSKNKATRKD